MTQQKNSNYPLAIKAIMRFVRMEAFAGLLIIFFSTLAMLAANSGLQQKYFDFIHYPLVLGVPPYQLTKSLLLWVNDGLMAFFFLLIGLEIKQETIEGELSHRSQILLPGFAAIGGVIAPILIFVLFNRENPQALRGWAIPAATDIAFALGVLALLGTRIPASLKIFLMTLAIFDDLVAIIIIAIFYTESLSLLPLSLAIITLGAIALYNRTRVQHILPYFLFGGILWFAVYKSGIHATLAGVALAMMIPFKSRRNANYFPLKVMKEKIHSWVGFVILPLFAFANAGISLSQITIEAIHSSLCLGIALGLLIGKQLGVFGFAYLAIKLKWAKLPQGASWVKLYGVSILCGIGFTMSLFISSLSFNNQPAHIDNLSRLGIFFGSLFSAIIGFTLLWFVSKPKITP